jgi:hypothetical protein
MKEGNVSVEGFLDVNNNNNDDNIDINVTKVDNDGEQSPNDGFIDLDLAELIPHVANCFMHKRDRLDDGCDKDIFVLNT